VGGGRDNRKKKEGEKGGGKQYSSLLGTRKGVFYHSIESYWERGMRRRGSLMKRGGGSYEFFRAEGWIGPGKGEYLVKWR